MNLLLEKILTEIYWRNWKGLYLWQHKFQSLKAEAIIDDSDIDGVFKSVYSKII